MGRLWRDNLQSPVSSHNFAAPDLTGQPTPELGLAVGIWSWDVPTGRVSWSAEQYRLHHINPREELSWETWTAAIAEDDRTAVIAATERALVTGEPFTEAYRTICARTGDSRYLVGRGIVTFDEDGKPATMTGCNIDCTRLWQSLTLMREQAEKLAVVVGADTGDPDIAQALTRQIRDGLIAAVQGFFYPPIK